MLDTIYDLKSLLPGPGHIVFIEVSINLTEKDTNCLNADFEDDVSLLLMVVVISYFLGTTENHLQFFIFVFFCSIR